ncbi:hypothetical protein ABE425_04720 [Chryseobacterium cucumeris]|uniref:hypothetical protein n=1 Tax=Chryseobacterium cucumeris TaxID=1813611 RepID=UPI0032091837
MENIKRAFINGITVPYYLHIEGGTGHGNKQLGGTFNFTAGYFNPTELDGRGLVSLEKWCEQKNIPFVHGETFDEILSKLEKFER